MIISVENGSFSYKKSLRNQYHADKDEDCILKNLSFKAQSGDILAILGPNGAGKTTLLRCMMGLLKWQSGSSKIDEIEIPSISRRKLWQIMAYVPQAKNAVSGYTVKETVLLGRSSYIGAFSKPCEEDIKKVNSVLKKLNLDNISHKKCSEISGGELQMVLIAKALASEPQILVLDEPESNLDFKNQLIVLETMSRLATKGMICIFNTHYPNHALLRANKSLMLNNKGEYIFGQTHQIVTEENIEKVFGVKSMVSNIETGENTFRNVLPLKVSQKASGDLNSSISESEDKRSLAAIAIITGDFEVAEEINKILHKFSEFLIGRMGMPYHEAGVYIINVTLDAPESEIFSLENRLNMLSNVSVKTTFYENAFDFAQKNK